MNRCVMLTVASMLSAGLASAQPTVDGRLTGDNSFYGAALSVQNTNTQFGNAMNGDPINGGGGSEIDQVFATVSSGRLYVLIAGNLEPNFNKMEVFIDSVPGGVNTIDGFALPTGVDAFCCGGFGTTDGALQRMDFLTFDDGFNADYFVTFSNGFETVNPGLPDAAGFWAISAHYADLTQGTAGTVAPLGMQLAHRGLPNVLRFPGDYNNNGIVDAADYTIWRDTEGQSVPRGSGADANGSQLVDQADYDIWLSRFSDDTTLGGFPFQPTDLANGVSEALVGPALPGLGQGELIDRDYALGPGGCTNDTGAGCVARELEFALNVDPNEIGTNQSSHRNFNNVVDLQLGFDNSNTAGVTGDGPYDVPTTGNPQDVTTGLEFSIPLSQIGNPTGPIKLTIFVNGGGHDFASNQFAGEGLLSGNVGSLMPDLEFEFAGNQFVTVPNPGAGGGSFAAVPEPGTGVLALVALWIGCLASRRRI